MPAYKVTVLATLKDVPQHGDWKESSFIVEASDATSAKPLAVVEARKPDSEIAMSKGYSKHYATGSHEYI